METGHRWTASQKPRNLRLGAIPGATPDKWATRWRERHPGVTLQIAYFEQVGQLDRVREGVVDLGYLREVEDPRGEPASPDPEVFHRVWLYTETPIVCAAADHWIAAAEAQVEWAEIAEESFLDPRQMAPAPLPVDLRAPRSGEDLAAGERLALEVAASGAGLVLLPGSVARMLSRKDLVLREVTGLPGYRVGLCWLRSADDEVIQEFIGIARGRRAGSGRSEITRTEVSPDGSRTTGAGKTEVRRADDGGARQRPRPGRRPGPRRARPPRGRRRPR